MAKLRADVMLFARGLVPSRERARALIMAGEVFSGTKKIEKPSDLLQEDAELSIKNQSPYVSRGGLKLEKALKVFAISLAEMVCADIGASTGGFTDCMLQNGAKKVYAVDVGYGQLDWSLRKDVRVVVMERTNARYLTAQDFAEIPVFASVDVSFISLKHIFPALKVIGVAQVVTLIKPQFEAGKENIGKNGVVKDPAVHRQVIEKAFEYANENEFYVRALDFSPIKGPSGNIEFIAHYTRKLSQDTVDIAQIVKNSQEFFREFPKHPTCIYHQKDV